MTRENGHDLRQGAGPVFGGEPKDQLADVAADVRLFPVGHQNKETGLVIVGICDVTRDDFQPVVACRRL